MSDNGCRPTNQIDPFRPELVLKERNSFARSVENDAVFL